MADLRTDYKDDLLDTSVNTQRKYRMVTNDDGTVSFVDETVYTQNGDAFGASEVNQIHAAVNLVNESLNVDTSELSEDYSLNALLQILAEKYFPNIDYIYNNGESIIPLETSTTAYTLADFTNDGSVSFGTNSIIFNVGATNLHSALIGLQEKIDFTPFKTVEMIYQTTTGGGTEVIATLDVSNINEERFLAFGPARHGGGDVSMYMYVSTSKAVTGTNSVAFRGESYATPAVKSIRLIK